jgi:hypothetical protein
VCIVLPLFACGRINSRATKRSDFGQLKQAARRTRPLAVNVLQHTDLHEIAKTPRVLGVRVIASVFIRADRGWPALLRPAAVHQLGPNPISAVRWPATDPLSIRASRFPAKPERRARTDQAEPAAGRPRRARVLRTFHHRCDHRVAFAIGYPDLHQGLTRPEAFPDIVARDHHVQCGVQIRRDRPHRRQPPECAKTVIASLFAHQSCQGGNGPTPLAEPFASSPNCPVAIVAPIAVWDSISGRPVHPSPQWIAQPATTIRSARSRML